MAETFDFEQNWQKKLSASLDREAGRAIRVRVMQGCQELTRDSNREEVIDWSRQAMEKLDALLDPGVAQTIMASCACRYPTADLQAEREVYARTGEIDRVHQMLQDKFELFLRNTLQLDESLIQTVVERGWGLAGNKDGDTIVATKIPKSGFLEDYFNEPDPEKRRQLYCHCPRVRDGVAMGEMLPVTYCYCGAGFYQGIWEDILQQPVKVDILSSVLQGDDLCTIAIHLPPANTSG
ncbi:MAG: hypothetical protein U9R25_05325 [Chloroflexota bacterium]|nr:hypothetical protein [Chloroflexota bacterium]